MKIRRKFRRGRGRKKPSFGVRKWVYKQFDKRVEDKYKYSAPLNSNLPNSDTVTALSSGTFILTDLSKGTNIDQRIGQQIRVKWVKVECDLTVTGATADLTGPSQARLAIFVHRTPCASTPTITGSLAGLFIDSTVGVIGSNIRNPQTSVVYRLLKQKIVNFPVHGGSSNSGHRVKVTLFKRFKKPLVVTYNNAVTSSYQDALKNSIWFTSFGSGPVNTNISYTYRGMIAFEDA